MGRGSVVEAELGCDSAVPVPQWDTDLAQSWMEWAQLAARHYCVRLHSTLDDAMEVHTLSITSSLRILQQAQDAIWQESTLQPSTTQVEQALATIQQELALVQPIDLPSGKVTAPSGKATTMPQSAPTAFTPLLRMAATTAMARALVYTRSQEGQDETQKPSRRDSGETRGHCGGG